MNTNTKNKNVKTMVKSMSNRNQVQTRRDTKGKFISNRIVPGRLYAMQTPKGELVTVRAQAWTRNNLILVNFKKILFAIVKPSSLKNISKSEVETYIGQA